MKYKDLRDFISQLEHLGELRRVTTPVSPVLEMTELCDRVLRAGGPALLFEQPTGQTMPVLGNLFGTPGRVALGMGVAAAESGGAEARDATALTSLRDIGRLLSALKEPEPPKGLKDAGRLLTLAKAVWDMAPKTVSAPPCQEIVWEGQDVDLARLPIQTCWPGDAAPLITWGLTVTRGPNKPRQNLGIYRQQLLGRNRLIMRWLAHRGGALDFREFALAHPGQPYPVAVALGCDPATILGAVTPVPDTLSEYQFAGLLRGGKTELAKCLTPGLEAGSGACRDRTGRLYLSRARRRRIRADADRRWYRIMLDPAPHLGHRRAIRACARRPLRRPHRLLQRARVVSGVYGRAHHDAARSDLPLHVYR